MIDTKRKTFPASRARRERWLEPTPTIHQLATGAGRWPGAGGNSGRAPCPDPLPAVPPGPQFWHCYDRLRVPTGPYERNWTWEMPERADPSELCYPGAPTWPDCAGESLEPGTEFGPDPDVPWCVDFEVLRVKGKIGGKLELRVEVGATQVVWSGTQLVLAGQLQVRLYVKPIVGPTPPKIAVKSPMAGLIEKVPSALFAVPFIGCYESQGSGDKCLAHASDGPHPLVFFGPSLETWSIVQPEVAIQVRPGTTAKLLAPSELGVSSAPEFGTTIGLLGNSPFQPDLVDDFDLSFRVPLCKA